MENSVTPMKIFLDTADTEIINKHFATGLIDGVTTNPTLIRKSGRDPEDVYQELIDLGLGDISMEVGGNAIQMLEGLWVCKELHRDHIDVNVTLIFDAAQAILAAKAGAKYVSPFVGRLDDNSITGLDLIKDIKHIYTVQRVHETQILSASIRYVNSVSQSFANGADIVTMPPAVFEKMYNHVLTDKGLEIFNKDLEVIANENH